MRLTILVVDDDPIHRHIIETAIKSAGCIPISADGCAVAQEAIKDKEIHGAFVDMVMHSCSGLDIGEDLVARNIPVVFVTGVDDDHNRAMMSQIGFVMKKPLAIQGLLMAIRYFQRCQQHCKVADCSMRERGVCR